MKLGSWKFKRLSGVQLQLEGGRRKCLEEVLYAGKWESP